MKIPFSFLAAPGGPPPAWSPRSASVPLLAWYRPDLGASLTGGQIDTLADQSGAGDANRNQLGSGGGRPSVAPDAAYGGQDVITFAGQRLDSAGAWTSAPGTPITIVIVGDATPIGGWIGERAPTPYNMIYWNGGGSVYAFNGAAVTAGADLTVPSVVMVEDDGSLGLAACGLYVNDLTTPLATGTTVLGAGTGYDLGRGNAGVAAMTGRQAEVMIFAGILSSTDRANLVTYLNVTRAYGIPVT